MPRVRWLVLALLFAFAFTGYVQRTGVAIAAERMMPELGLTQVQVGWLFTAFLFTYSVFQLPGALVGQWAGARRALAVVGLATLLGSAATAGAAGLAAGAALFAALLLARWRILDEPYVWACGTEGRQRLGCQLGVVDQEMA